jgi:imidazolonepropionase-like amidohydrolase/ABC-type transport system involved in cytochrome c biogenesis permease component
MKPYIAQIRSNLRLMGRDRTVLFFNFFFPLIFFVIFAVAFGGSKNPGGMAQVVNMVLVLGVLGSGFFGAGMRAVQDRETNILRRFKVAPVGPAPIIVASMVAGLVSFIPIVFVVLAVGHIWARMPLPERTIDFILFVCLGLLAFRAVGMIIAAVVNSAQEGQIVTQILYLPMLFLSGATFPLQFFPHWLQIFSQFIPATYLFQGMQSMFLARGSLVSNWLPMTGLIVTLVVSLFIGVKLFRWEKEEKIAGSAKLWILGVLAPFLLMGLYQVKSEKNLQQDKILARNMRRNETVLFQNARIFVGDGRVIVNGAVLIRGGKIAQVFDPAPAETKSFNATVVDASGKTLLPGLIDMHVHLNMPGGVYRNVSDYAKKGTQRRELAAYLYSGVTAVRSTGDALDTSLALRQAVNSGEYLGAQLFACGPMFTTKGGHGTEYAQVLPQSMRQTFLAETVRTPKSPEEARVQVDSLKNNGVNCIKAVLDAGTAGALFNRMDTRVYDAIVQQAKADGLPSATHTGDLRDVQEAIAAATSTIEYGSMRAAIPAALFEQIRRNGIAYNPALSAAEAARDVQRHQMTLLGRSLVQQVAPKSLLDSTQAILGNAGGADESNGVDFSRALDIAEANLLTAWKAGDTLIAGSDAGHLLVIHGPTVQHELELWVEAGIPAGVALRAATFNAAQVLHASAHIGSIQPGRDATLIMVEGNPLEDISNLERVTYVMFRGEHVDRSELFSQDTND